MLGKRFDGGVDLSGGEWQKVALARAYMRDAQLLILDEPTAALDARAEYEVFLRFSELTKGRMAVLISHQFWSRWGAVFGAVSVAGSGVPIALANGIALLPVRGFHSTGAIVASTGRHRQQYEQRRRRERGK